MLHGVCMFVLFFFFFNQGESKKKTGRYEWEDEVSKKGNK